MSDDRSTMDVAGFLRLFQLRAGNIMWFLGSGASRAAGIKTASDMIWEFKERLYRSEKKLSPFAITDIGDPLVQRKLQAHFDGLQSFPPFGAEEEYSAYFEATYHSARDRRTYLDSLFAKGKPSFGHFAMALLMSEQLCRVVWTTNFDRTMEDAAAQVLGSTGRLVTADLADPQKLSQAWNENRWPVYAKLHGDYQSEHLKNTARELREQDEAMRQVLVDACRRQALAVIGYSGRDASIMSALRDALDAGRGYPGGLFWFKRNQDELYSTPRELISDARKAGIDAHIVETESFDELLSDIVRFLPQTADKIHTLTSAARPRLVKAAPRPSTTATPVVRTFALPITSYPALCRLVDCKIGGWSEIQEAIGKVGVDVIAQRSSSGVLAFGRDHDIRRAFEPYAIKSFETYPLSSAKLIRETGERAIIRDALLRALGKRPGLMLERRGRSSILLPDPAVVTTDIFSAKSLRPIDRLSGTVSQTNIIWTEACGLRLDYRLDRLWLLLEPRVVLQVVEGTSQNTIEEGREFVRQRRASRHNQVANAILDGWVKLIAGMGSSLRLRTFEIADGIDAEFELTRVSAFSGRTR